MAAIVTTPPPPMTDPREWDRLVAQADRWVREVLGKYEHGKEVRWERDPGPPTAAKVTLRADGYEATGRLNPDELTNRREVRWKALDLWGQLGDAQMKAEFQDLRRYLAEWREELTDAG